MIFPALTQHSGGTQKFIALLLIFPKSAQAIPVGGGGG